MGEQRDYKIKQETKHETNTEDIKTGERETNKSDSLPQTSRISRNLVLTEIRFQFGFQSLT